MKRNVMLKLCVIVLILSGSAVCRSQDRFELIQRNPDGSIWIRINGENYLAITGKQSDDWVTATKELEGAKKTNAELNVQIKEALLQRDLAQAQKALIQQKSDSFEKDFNRAREDAARFQSLFMSERELRQEASSFVPHGNKTKFDKFLALFDSKAVQFAIKGFAPIWTAVRCQ